MKRTSLILLVGALLLAACSTDGGGDRATELGDPGNCMQIDMAVSPEKIDLLTSLAQTFNRLRTRVGDRCVFVSPKSKASGGAMQALAAGGGVTQRGTQRGIKVNRRDAQGKLQELRPGMNDPLQSGDVIYVRESLF